ncbi:hypothetical protein CVT24_013194 [Panaeolus cyanescens]|uniref:TECPR1-like DysF domain-containing protein n=1 Tax=Panaeolus cyanescens TaxID=181874 RepID=A0A409YMU0_9AGAR|nr:hypothetical protein CVT24_013194 [Panaeolus cyanescens]
MATLDYIDIPAGATRLRTQSSGSTNDTKQASSTNDIRPAPRITTSLPHPSPPSSPTQTKSPTGSTFGNISSPTVGLLPQLMLQASIPGLMTAPAAGTAGGPAAAAGANVPTNPRGKLDAEPYTLLSTRDPLSLPIMTTNFKRFVSIIGPVFWLQDRVEEIVLWKCGHIWTGIWMGVYGLICFFPRALLLVPHLGLIAIILATYPYPSSPSDSPIYNINGESTSEGSPGSAPPPTHPPEGSIPWQANIQGIQNLMGAVADAHALVEPHLYHLCLRPSHLSTSVKSSNVNSGPAVPTSPYTPHILVFLVVTFFPLLFLVNLPVFPIREVCLIAGWAPFVASHPWSQALSSQALALAQDWWATHQQQVWTYISIIQTRFVRLRAFASRTPPPTPSPVKSAISVLDDFGAPPKTTSRSSPLPLKMRIQRFLDDDKLTDQCWNSEMREVEIWENERYSETSQPPSGVKGWSKRNLKSTERMAWTRGRDGWSGIGGGNASGDGEEGYGEVSSNLTFSLAPGWAFVETEDWRKDLSAEWSGCGSDEDGWVYTNDAWLGSRPAPYGAGGGSVTRRRRWVRRVWFDQERAKRDS